MNGKAKAAECAALQTLARPFQGLSKQAKPLERGAFRRFCSKVQGMIDALGQKY